MNSWYKLIRCFDGNRAYTSRDIRECVRKINHTDIPNSILLTIVARFRLHMAAGIFILIGMLSTPCHATTEYITQTFIDTMIQKAFEMFNVEEALPDRVEAKRREAIDHAKGVAVKLKHMAEGNPNQKYILFKVGELESQIYLEEQGLLAAKQNQNLKSINDLVPQFNSETGKHRPNFPRLWQIKADMERYDRAKGEELNDLIADRSRNITKEVLYSFETAMEDKDFDKARDELTYCKINEGCLDISLTQYSRMEAKLQSQTTVDNEIMYAKNATIKADTLVNRKKLGQARDIMNVVSLRVDGLRDKMIRTEWEKLVGRTQRTTRSIDRKEDSLAAVQTVILKKQGVGAAKTFLDSLEKNWEISREKLNQLEFAILQKVMEQKQAEEDSATAQRFTQIASAAPSAVGSSVFDDLRAQAKRKAQGKSDSLKSIQDDNARLTQFEEVRRDQMRVTREGMQKREDDRIALGKQRAKESLIEIYSLLEQKKNSDAVSQFRREKDQLSHYLPADDYGKLDSSISKNESAAKKK